ncbi:hypothetical protein MKX01_027222, partial [Papaver californicum]
MGCLVSTPQDTRAGGNRKRQGNVGEMVVFIPVYRIPKPVDFSQPLGDSFSKSLVERLSALRTRGSTVSDLQQALEDYLPVLLGLLKEGSNLQYMVHFMWVNQEDEETAIPNVWYEVFSDLHLMVMLSLSQANMLFLPKTTTDESKRLSVDVFLRAAGYLDYALKHVFPSYSWISGLIMLPINTTADATFSLLITKLNYHIWIYFTCNNKIKKHTIYKYERATLLVQPFLLSTIYWKLIKEKINKNDNSH